MLVLHPVHGDVKLVQVSVAKQLIVNQVELSPGMGE